MFSLLGSGLQHTIVVPVESTTPSITVGIPAERLTNYTLLALCTAEFTQL
jgi:hypothetical protein